MNIKRAFLAAVLMVPGLAMAQSTQFFETSVMGADDADVSEMGVTITCDGGLPLTQSSTTPVTFTVTEVPEGTVCSITVDTATDPGWEMDVDNTDCGPFTATAESATFICTLAVEPSASTFSTTVMWEVSEEADPGVGVGSMLTQVCMNAWDGTTYTTTGQTSSAGPGVAMPISLAVTPGPDGSTDCYAILANSGSAVEVDNSGCASESLLPDGMGASCTIYATAFFEGIPTLSQYGMAIMALLMLGVGFVGFRRFV